MYLRLKYFLDFLFALFLAFLLLPLFVLIPLLIVLFIGKPVLFRQCRIGYQGRRFHVYKFRTMTDCVDADGVLLADEFRLTPIGQFLRSSSLDELPGLINIFRGEMSFIGPRPLLAEYLPYYSPEQFKRHCVRPGLSGWAQVNGRNLISWDEKFAKDLWYVNHQSFCLDMRIFLLTIWKIFSREGITAVGNATVIPFTSSNPRR